MIDKNYEVDYQDQRFLDVETEKGFKVGDVNDEYNTLILHNDQKEQEMLASLDKNQQQQIDIANKNTEFAIDKIEQSKEWAQKDYVKEQSGAYTDWQKQSNKYGVNAEQQASMGMGGTGYSESSQVAMYNQYQNRVATAREAFVRASTEFDIAIKDAQLQNSSLLAQIASETLAKKLELSLTFLQNRQSLVTQKAQAIREVEKDYYDRWKDVLNQINQENALKEEARQYNETLAENKRVHDASIAAQNAQMALAREELELKKKQQNTQIIKDDDEGKETVIESDNEHGGRGGRIPASEEPTIDMDSVLALGYGAISPSKLSELVASGKVIKYVENGKIKFKKAFAPIR